MQCVQKNKIKIHRLSHGPISFCTKYGLFSSKSCTFPWDCSIQFEIPCVFINPIQLSRICLLAYENLVLAITRFFPIRVSHTIFARSSRFAESDSLNVFFSAGFFSGITRKYVTFFLITSESDFVHTKKCEKKPNCQQQKAMIQKKESDLLQFPCKMMKTDLSSNAYA